MLGSPFGGGPWAHRRAPTQRVLPLAVPLVAVVLPVPLSPEDDAPVVPPVPSAWLRAWSCGAPGASCHPVAPGPTGQRQCPRRRARGLAAARGGRPNCRNPCVVSVSTVTRPGPASGAGSRRPPVKHLSHEGSAPIRKQVTPRGIGGTGVATERGEPIQPEPSHATDHHTRTSTAADDLASTSTCRSAAADVFARVRAEPERRPQPQSLP